MKVYAAVSDYRIEAVFLDCSLAEALCERRRAEFRFLWVEEHEIVTEVGVGS